MERRNFAAIAKRLKTNGVGFVQLFFRIAYTPEELVDAEGPKQFAAHFSDGKKYLGSLVIDTEMISDHSPDWKVPVFKMNCSGVSFPEMEERMELAFSFTAPYKRGECTITLGEDYESFED